MRVRKTQVAPVLGKRRCRCCVGNRHQELLDVALRLVAGAFQETRADPATHAEESPWWLPGAVDDRINDRSYAVEGTLRQSPPIRPTRSATA